MVEASDDYDKKVPFGVTDNTKLFCVAYLEEFEHTCLTKTRRYTRKDLPFTDSCRGDVFVLAKTLMDKNYVIEGIEEFDL